MTDIDLQELETALNEWDSIDCIPRERLPTIVEAARSYPKMKAALESILNDLKMRIDATGRCDGYKDEDGIYVFPWGNSVMHMIDEALATDKD